MTNNQDRTCRALSSYNIIVNSLPLFNYSIYFLIRSYLLARRKTIFLLLYATCLSILWTKFPLSYLSCPIRVFIFENLTLYTCLHILFLSLGFGQRSYCPPLKMMMSVSFYRLLTEMITSIQFIHLNLLLCNHITTRQNTFQVQTF